ncbi:hypothetical protein N9L76_04810, partial [bacterium]|nr:hypothetical protein [bacterium]
CFTYLQSTSGYLRRSTVGGEVERFAAALVSAGPESISFPDPDPPCSSVSTVDALEVAPGVPVSDKGGGGTC